jgi:hypothetical protein
MATYFLVREFRNDQAFCTVFTTKTAAKKDAKLKKGKREVVEVEARNPIDAELKSFQCCKLISSYK